LVESISSESDEIRLSPSQQRERETIRCRPANNEKNHVRHHVKITPLDMPQPRTQGILPPRRRRKWPWHRSVT
jgi:hypothetical protein